MEYGGGVAYEDAEVEVGRVWEEEVVCILWCGIYNILLYFWALFWAFSFAIYFDFASDLSIFGSAYITPVSFAHLPAHVPFSYFPPLFL